MSEEKKDSSSNCGANAEGGGGFQEGNTCATGSSAKGKPDWKTATEWVARRMGRNDISLSYYGAIKTQFEKYGRENDLSAYEIDEMLAKAEEHAATEEGANFFTDIYNEGKAEHDRLKALRTKKREEALAVYDSIPSIELDKLESDTVEDYITGGSGDITDAAREGRNDPRVDRLDNVIAKSKLKKSVPAYHGLEWEHYDTTTREDMVGKIIHDPAHISVTTSRNVGQMFDSHDSETGVGGVLVFDIPEGTNYYKVGNDRGSGFSKESELILGRDVGFRITGMGEFKEEEEGLNTMGPYFTAELVFMDEDGKPKTEKSYTQILVIKSSDCGANQEGGGGFVEGNTCATGGKAESSGISKSSRDMSEIFGQGAIEEKYTHGDSGGRARVLVRPNGVASTLELYVPKERRGQGIGRSLMSSIMSDHPKLMGQVSSKAAAKIAYDQGRRPYNEPDATLARVFSLIDDNSSVNLLSPALMEEQTSKSFSGVSSKKSSDCGANQEGGGGFVEGNTCATGEKAQESDSQEDDFDRWFAGSKAVNEKGDPLTVYHGTDADFENFELGKQNKKTFTPVQGLFFTNRRSEAAGYGSRVIEANLSIKNPASREQVVEAMHKANEGVAWKDKDPAKATQYLIDRGFDGAIYQEDGGMGAMYIAFDPKQVRQIKNKKSFGLLSIKKSDCGANAEGGGGFQAGNTCAKGESGKKTGYHGSPKKDIEKFNQSETGTLGKGVYLSGGDNQPSGYTGGDGRIYEVEFDLKNPVKVSSYGVEGTMKVLPDSVIEDYYDNHYGDQDWIQRQLIDAGYDGVHYSDRRGPEFDEYLVFDPDAVKIKNKSFNVVAIKSSDCGANQEGGGGFVEGNTCATGERAKDKKKKLPKQETTKIERLEKRIDDLRERIYEYGDRRREITLELHELDKEMYEGNEIINEAWVGFLETEAGQEFMKRELDKRGLPREDIEQWLKDNPGTLLTEDKAFMNAMVHAKNREHFYSDMADLRMDGIDKYHKFVEVARKRRHRVRQQLMALQNEKRMTAVKMEGLANRIAAVEQKIFFEKNPVSEEIGWRDHQHKSIKKIAEASVQTQGLKRVNDATDEQIDRAIDGEYSAFGKSHVNRSGRRAIVDTLRDDPAETHWHMDEVIGELKSAPYVASALKEKKGIDLESFDPTSKTQKESLASAIDELTQDPLYRDHIGKAGWRAKYRGDFAMAKVAENQVLGEGLVMPKDNVPIYLDIINDHNPDAMGAVDQPENLRLWSNIPDSNKLSNREVMQYRRDYRETQVFAKGLRVAVQDKIVEKRGLDPEKMKAVEEEMWKEWKKSSSNEMSTFAKIAAHEEFGTLHRFEEGDINRLKQGSYSPSQAVTDPEELLEYLKAHNRATWETSQYLMKEAGVDKVGLYRGMVLKEGMVDTEDLTSGDRIKDIDIVRSALQSTTTDAEVANNWDGTQGNVMADRGARRVVMRFESEPNDVLSLPLYGDNVHGENEVVLLGTNWEDWDARFDKAQLIEDAPIGYEKPKPEFTLDDFEGSVPPPVDLENLKGIKGKLSTKSYKGAFSDEVGERPALLIEENWDEWKASIKDKEEKKKSFSLAKRSFAVVAIKSPKEDPEKSDCGANAPGGGGFQEGNTCATGEKKEVPESWKILAEAGRDYRENGTKSEKFKEWFGDWENDPENASKVVDENGEPSEKRPFSAVTDEDGNPIIVYHGTTHEFNEFNRDHANIENHMGAGFYFSDQMSDSEINYGAEGADLTNRIELAAEQHLNSDEFTMLLDDAMAKREGAIEDFSDFLENDLGLERSEIDEVMDLTGSEDMYGVAKEVAKHQLTGEEPKVIKSYLNLRKPLVMGEPEPTTDWRGRRGKLGPMEAGETIFELEYEELDYEGRTPDDPDFDWDTAEYTGVVRGNGKEFIDNLRKRAKENDFYYNHTEEGLMELEQELNEYGSMRAGVLVSKAKSKLYDLQDDMGRMASSEIVRQALEDSGFDGIIYQDASKHFPNFGQSGGEPLREGTKHYVVFDPKNIKAYDNQGTFDPEDANIYKSFKVFPIKSSNCGANAEGGGGFQEGNTCATGERAKDPHSDWRDDGSFKFEKRRKKYRKDDGTYEEDFKIYEYESEWKSPGGKEVLFWADDSKGDGAYEVMFNVDGVIQATDKGEAMSIMRAVSQRVDKLLNEEGVNALRFSAYDRSDKSRRKLYRFLANMAQKKNPNVTSWQHEGEFGIIKNHFLEEAKEEYGDYMERIE